VVLGFCARGLAQGATEPPPAAPVAESPKLTFDPDRARRPWVIQVEPMLWWASPSGTLKLPAPATGNTRGVRVERLNLDTPQLSPAGEVHIQADRWRFTVSGGANFVDQTTVADRAFQIGDVAVARGESFSASLDVSVFEADVAYRVWSKLFAEHEARAPLPALLNLSVVGGVRLYDIDASVERSAGGVARSEEFFGEPVIGLRADLELYEDFTIDVQTTVGAFGGDDRSSGSLDISVGFMYWPHPNFAAQIGWRQVLYWLEDGKGAAGFEYEGGVAGLFGGVVLRF